MRGVKVAGGGLGWTCYECHDAAHVKDVCDGSTICWVNGPTHSISLC